MVAASRFPHSNIPEFNFGNYVIYKSPASNISKSRFCTSFHIRDCSDTRWKTDEKVKASTNPLHRDTRCHTVLFELSIITIEYCLQPTLSNRNGFLLRHAIGLSHNCSFLLPAWLSQKKGTKKKRFPGIRLPWYRMSNGSIQIVDNYEWVLFTTSLTRNHQQ